MLRVLILAGVVAAAASNSPTRSSPSAALLRVVAHEYAFEVTPPAHAGVVTVRLVNHGRETHHLEITLVPDTMSLRTVYAIASGTQTSLLVHDMGGPNLTTPTDSNQVTLRLQPGHYVLSCWVIAADGKPHIMHGMMAEFRVTKGPSELPTPIPAVRISASDYKFVVAGQLRRGPNVVAFDNGGPQEHDIQFVRLNDGQSASAVADWARHGGVGTPTQAVAGGSSGIDKGNHVWFTLTLHPGRYAMFCFVPDAKDGKMHLLHGMLREITVQ